MKLQEEIGRELFHLRVMKRMTQQEAAEKAGISLRTLQNLEKGSFDFRIGTLEKLCNVYDAIVKIEKQ